ncbi:MAG TPA: tripartite tricarboxylate transporter substrate binding protein [Usitatibacteraceae bacterium]
MNRPTTLNTLSSLLAVIAFLSAPAILSVPAIANAEDAWPSKPIKIIAPVQPGGGVDLVARLVADRLGKVLGQSIIVDNQSGGGGIVGSQSTARAAPDGYTLMVGYVGTHGTNPALRKLPYDAIKDFTPIAMVGGTPNIMVVNPNVPAKTLKEFIAYAKANPNKISYGSSGQGTLTHLVMEQLKEETGIDVAHVPYRGIGPALTDLLGGQTQISAPGLAAALPHIKVGKLRPLAITGATRHPLMPDVPTLAELGYKGFDGVQWYGIVGPAKMPPALVKRLNTEINKLIIAPELKEKLAGEALEPMPMTPEQFGEYMKNDIAKWEKLVKARNIQIND